MYELQGHDMVGINIQLPPARMIITLCWILAALTLRILFKKQSGP